MFKNNQIIFKNYIRYNHDIDLTLTPVNLQEDFKIIKTRIADKKTFSIIKTIKEKHKIICGTTMDMRVLMVAERG